MYFIELDAKNKILISIIILFLFAMLFFIVFGENGLVDLGLLKQEKDRLMEANRRLEQENLTLYREINRLRNDMAYIESVARKELGMVKEEEIILKLRNRNTDENGR